MANLSLLLARHRYCSARGNCLIDCHLILTHSTLIKLFTRHNLLSSGDYSQARVLPAMNESRVLSFLKDLIATNSENPPGREDCVAKVIRNHLEAYGISCISVGPSKRPNLIFSSHEGEKGNLVLHGHMDTVPIGDPNNWKHDPFGAEIQGGLLYGRGACDMKGPVSAIVETLILYTEEKHEKPLLVLTTSDEESGCSGAEEVAKSGRLSGVKFGVCAEPTDLQVLVGEKGIFWFKVIAEGKSAHGSRPEEGINAIKKCIDAIEAISFKPFPHEIDELLGIPTLNIGMIEGGIKVNVVPAHCEAQLDIRTVKGQTPDSLTDLMNERLNSAGLSDRVRIEYIHGKPAVSTAQDSDIVRVASDEIKRVLGTYPSLSAATYGTDCSVLQPKVGITNVICGPGSIEQAHQPDEFIKLEQLFHSVDIYLGIARFFDQ
ncbi:M20 family peptidase [Candidatus Thorarchaeota archaeon]|nr:MAG: M20 family peptidase [Candidatus Thorarchaeota archaeon]